MSLTDNIRNTINSIDRGEVFTYQDLQKLGDKKSVSSVLSKMVKKDEISKSFRGLYYRPKSNQFIKKLNPFLQKILDSIESKHGEIFQINGAEATRQLKLSTQMSVIPTLLTNGPSRTVIKGNARINLRHCPNNLVLQHAGTVPGLVISCLWYLGEHEVTPETIKHIKSLISTEDFEIVKQSILAPWQRKVIGLAEEGL